MQAFITEISIDPAAAWLFSLLVKTLFVLGVTALLVLALRRHISSSTAHLLWLSGLLISALLPVAELFRKTIPNAAGDFGSITLLTITPVAEAGTATAGWPAGSMLFGLYLLVALVGIASLTYAAWCLQHLNRLGTPAVKAELTSQFTRLCEQLGIVKPVSLLISEDIDSPVSYGLRNPVVLLPSDAEDWSPEVREQVLIHELSHIRRGDWLTLLFSKALCMLLWANPLVWLASKHLHDEAEQACDTVVASLGNSRVSYAENLLDLAKQRKAKTVNQWGLALAQPMYGKHSLSTRITNILDGKLVASLNRSLKVASLATVLVASAGFSAVQLIAAESGQADRDYLPTRAVAPQYPTKAAEEGVEGWLLLEFTVRADGLVDANTIRIVDSEPAGYFENNSIRAAEQFEFEPRIVDGLAVDVPGVQYLFRYQLSEGSADFGRPPPEANRR